MNLWIDELLKNDFYFLEFLSDWSKGYWDYSNNFSLLIKGKRLIKKTLIFLIPKIFI